MSVVFHVIFYAALIKLDSWAIMQARAGGQRQVSLVRLIELAPPPERSTLRTAPEPLERADINRLQFDPASADDVHLVERSPKPAERRGTEMGSAFQQEDRFSAARSVPASDIPSINRS